jgi:predicted RNA-binding protein with PUA-like domain
MQICLAIVLVVIHCYSVSGAKQHVSCKPHDTEMPAAVRRIATFNQSTAYSYISFPAFVPSKMSKRRSTSMNTKAASCDQGALPQYFLLKSEPDDYSISDLQRDGTEEWNGIRNYQARNFLRTMKVGDRAFFYHSKAPTPALTGIVGTCRIARTAQPDQSALDPKSEYYDAKCTKENCKWDSVLVEYEQTFPVVLSLKELKEIATQDSTGTIARLALLKQSRLSVVPLNQEEWDEVMRLLELKIGSLAENTEMQKDTEDKRKRQRKSK